MRSFLQACTYLLLVSLGTVLLFGGTEYYEKKSLNLESGAIYLKSGATFLRLEHESAHPSLSFTFVDWTSFDVLECYIHDDLQENEISLEKLEVFAHGGAGSGTFHSSTTGRKFWQHIKSKVGDDATLYLKVKASNGRSYFSVLSRDTSNKPFISELLKSNFYSNLDLEIHFRKQYAEQQNLIPSFSVDKQIQPTVINNEFISKGKLASLRLETKRSDSLHILVKTESGIIKKYDYLNAQALDMSEILKDHVETSSIYFSIGNATSPDRENSILIVADDQTLLAAQPELLNKTVGISIDKVSWSSLKFRAEDLNFVWGELQMKLVKNKAGNYYAKKRIGISKWKNAHLNKPNLVLGKTLFMDSLSFDLSIATQDVDTINKVVLKDIQTRVDHKSLRLNLQDTLTTLPKDQQKKFIRLEDISNENIGVANVSLEIELYDDRPKVKKKKYQFHWGSIDTTLIQGSANNSFSQVVDLSLSKFRTTFKKEPVLTSSAKGVVEKFDYRILHFRKGKLLSSSKASSDLKDAAVFVNSIKESTILKNVKVGDKIVLKTFTGPEIMSKEELHLDVLISENTIADAGLSIDDENLFLEWGDLKLKTIPLGDNSPKKRLQDQVVDRKSLLNIVDQQTILNKFGLKENIIHAEWFVNDNIYTENKCDSKNWKNCFASQLKEMKGGDYVSIFMRAKNGAGIMSQFYLDFVSKDAIIGFGNTEFDSLLFKYSKYLTMKAEKPKFQYEFRWGNSKIDLDLKGNPRVYGGERTIKKEELINMLNETIEINSSDGEVFTINNAYLVLTGLPSADGKYKFKGYDFDCENLDCALSSKEALQVLERLEGHPFSARIFINQHAPSEENIKVSFIDFIIEDEGNEWIPKRWISGREETDLFEFQFVYQNKEKTLIKLDQDNEKYTWIVDKYKNDTSVELLNLPGFKTSQRAIYTKYDFGNNEEIRNTQVLSKNYTNAYTLYEYHDLQSKKVNLYWKGYQSLRGAQSYCKEDFVCAEGGLELTVNGKEIEILRGDLVILPESSAGYKFVFENINSEEIVSILNDLPHFTSLFIENIIVKGKDGKPLRFPRKFAYHIE